MPIPAAFLKKGRKKPAEGSAAEEGMESSKMEKGESPEYGDAPHGKGKKPCAACMNKGKKKGSCGCEDKAKMDRALSPQEYLSACDLGIQGRSKNYIRSRLDAVATMNKGQGTKCGNSYIGKGKKCKSGAGGLASSTPASGGKKPAKFERNIALGYAGLNAIQAAQGLASGNYARVGAAVGSGIGNTLAARSFQKGNRGAGYGHFLGTSTALGMAGAAGGAVAGSPGTRLKVREWVKEARDNPYRDLGVKRGASPEEVKKAYRKKAQQTHPDAGGSAEAFRRTKASYEKINSKYKNK
jgi:hypothetical protein